MKSDTKLSVSKLNIIIFISSSIPVHGDSSEAGACESTAAKTIRSSILSGVHTTIEDEVASQLGAQLRLRYLGMTSRYPAMDCAELLQTNPSTKSGFYWIQVSGGIPIRVWCNMELVCGPSNITGWARVGFLNLSDSTVDCPSRFQEQTSTNGVRYCRRVEASSGCEEHIFQTNGLNFGRLCGRVTGIQIGTVDGFAPERLDDINNPYIDGVSLTYGNPRQHIWTFAGYYSAIYPECPCSNGSMRIPFDFIDQNYFCESGTNTDDFSETIVFDEDLLWDGKMCTNTEIPCCNGAPWFYRSLEATISENISFRLCSDQERMDEDMGFTLVEIYVQ